MAIRTVIFVVLALFGLTANADFKTVTRAYEVPMNEFTVPVSSNAMISNLKRCGSCDAVSARLTTRTRYIVNGTAVDLKEFRKAVLAVRNRDAETVVVKHHLETDTVTSIKVTL